MPISPATVQPDAEQKPADANLNGLISLLFGLVLSGLLGLYAFGWSLGKPPSQLTSLGTPTPTATATLTATRIDTPTATHSPTSSATPTTTWTVTVTATPTVTTTPTPTATKPATQTATPQPTASTTMTPKAQPASATPASQTSAKTSSSGDIPRLALASYFAWYDLAGWDGCNISAGDRPLQPYNSDDPEAIARHIALAQSAGIDGFTLSWFAPGERTDANLSTLLARSAGGFASTVVFQRHIWHGSPSPTQANIADAVRYIIERYSQHPNFLKINGRPVLFFTDLARVPGESPQRFWANVRQQTDPNHDTIWIAEGLDFSYLSTFDGQYIFKISHAAYPEDYVKSARWAGQVRKWEQTTGQTKLWIATLSPGWDDLRAGCRPDVRAPSALHKVDRGDGAFLTANYDAATASQPDLLWIHSFNEWVEGTYIEPSVQFGDRYLNLTRDLVRRFKSAP